MLLHPLHPTISERFALGAAPGAVEVPEEAQSAVEVNCLQQAQRAVVGTEPGHPSILPAVVRRKRSGLDWDPGAQGHGAGPQAQAAGLGTAGTGKTLARTHSQQLVAHSSSCSLCGWHWVKAKQSQWVVSTVHYKPGQQAGKFNQIV